MAEHSRDDPYARPEHQFDKLRYTSGTSWFGRLMILGAVLLVVLGAVAVLISMMLPFFPRGNPQAWERSQCISNLQQIAVALDLYSSDYGAYPPAYTIDEKGDRLHSWRTLLLPYLNEQDVYDALDLSKSWDDPANLEAFHENTSQYSHDVPFRCPSVVVEQGFTTYVAIAGPSAGLHPTRPRRPSEFKDGSVSSLMVIDVTGDHAVHWMQPADVGPEFLQSTSGDGPVLHGDRSFGLYAGADAIEVEGVENDAFGGRSDELSD